MNRKTANTPLRQRLIPLKHLIAPQGVRTVLLFAGFFVAYIGIAYLNKGGVFSTLDLSDYEVGKVAERDLVLDREVQYVDTEATQKKQENEARLVNPVFTVSEEVTRVVQSEYDTFSAIVENAVEENESVDATTLKLQSILPDSFRKSDVEYLLTQDNLSAVLDNAGEVIEAVQRDGVVQLPENRMVLSSDDAIALLQKVGGREYETVTTLQEVPTENTVYEHAEKAAIALGIPREQIAAIAVIVKCLARENAFYDSDETAIRREQARQEAEPVVQTLHKDETIAKKGFVITEDDMVKVRALGYLPAAVSFSALAGTAVLLILLFILSVSLFGVPVLEKPLDPGMQYMLFGLFFLYVVTAAVIHGLHLLPSTMPFSVLLPTSLFSMLVSILGGRRVGTFFVLLASLSLFLIERDTPYPFLFAFLSAIAGTVVVTDVEKRIELVRGSFILAGLSGLCIIPIGLFGKFGVTEIMQGIGLGVANGFICGILNLGLLPFFEHMLNAATPFRLMELSDLNTPLFKRMITLAPGTYGHCISVANLAESAAREIGANPVLARVGAYYHDIGKIDQAEYFIENQTEGNKHDDLKPSLSAAVIKSHVKIGIEKGKELGLPKEVLEIIAQHHGSGLISYFYVQALKKQGNTRINPEDFSYTGSPPMSREAAVVMLADTVEAASRTLSKPTVAKLEKFVWGAIMDKVTSGQLSKCELTFKDLENIKKTFVQILAGQFHSRIEYPDAKDNGRKAQGQ